jgi:hypothetical protein
MEKCHMYKIIENNIQTNHTNVNTCNSVFRALQEQLHTTQRSERYIATHVRNITSAVIEEQK